MVLGIQPSTWMIFQEVPTFWNRMFKQTQNRIDYNSNWSWQIAIAYLSLRYISYLYEVGEYYSKTWVCNRNWKCAIKLCFEWTMIFLNFLFPALTHHTLNPSLTSSHIFIVSSYFSQFSMALTKYVFPSKSILTHKFMNSFTNFSLVNSPNLNYNFTCKVTPIKIHLILSYFI